MHVSMLHFYIYYIIHIISECMMHHAKAYSVLEAYEPSEASGEDELCRDICASL